MLKLKITKIKLYQIDIDIFFSKKSQLHSQYQYYGNVIFMYLFILTLPSPFILQETIIPGKENGKPFIIYSPPPAIFNISNFYFY